jgi:hypothetical protein
MWHFPNLCWGWIDGPIGNFLRLHLIDYLKRADETPYQLAIDRRGHVAAQSDEARNFFERRHRIVTSKTQQNRVAPDKI